jgi:hypothetical protein
VRGDGNRPHNQVLCDRYCSPNIIWVIKLKESWAGRVYRLGKGEVHAGFR